jgi:hypothetical protein
LQARTRDGSLAALSAIQQATSGAGVGLDVRSDNADAAAVKVRAAGDLLDLQDASGVSQFTVTNTGAVTVTGDQTVTGDYTITGDLTVNGGAIFNEASADEDFRVESNGDANAIFVDGGNDRVGIFTAAPSTAFEVTGATTITGNTDIAGEVDVTTGDVSISTAGNGLQIAEGANARMGTATLSGGAATVTNTSVTANTVIFISRATTGGTEGHLSTAIDPGTDFDINSSSGSDTSTVNWLLIEPA